MHSGTWEGYLLLVKDQDFSVLNACNHVQQQRGFHSFIHSLISFVKGFYGRCPVPTISIYHVDNKIQTATESVKLLRPIKIVFLIVNLGS